MSEIYVMAWLFIGWLYGLITALIILATWYGGWRR